MESGNPINVKTFLEQPPQGGAACQNNAVEIRRFDIDPEVSTSYDYLTSKIAAIYPSLAEQSFRVYWKDEENDMVAISSDEELTQAVVYGRPNGLLKLYLISAAPSTPYSQPNAGAGENVEHPGVVCDGCDNSIRGLRFKCLVCADYDLCSICCDKGLHNHHYMLRLAHPAAEWTGCGRRGQGAGRHGAWWWPGGAAPGWGGPQGMRRLWRQFMRNQNGQGQEGAEAAPSGNPPPPTASADANACGDAQKEQQRDYLQHVGEQVSAMLEPLGVSVDVEVEERPGSGRQRCGKGKGHGRKLGGKGRQCSRDGNCRPDNRCAREGRCRSEQPQCSRGGRCQPDEECLRSSGSAPNSQCANSGKCKPAADCTTEGACMDTDQSQRSAGSADNSMMSNGPGASAPEEPEPSMGETNPRSDDVDMEGSDDASWVRIEPKSDGVLPNTPADEPQVMPAMRLYPSLSSVPVPEPSEPAASADSALEGKVAEAVEQMRAMGFHDDGGWMTALLYEHHGDVSKVIDSVLKTAQTSRRD